jgi:hypothetical protein
VFYLSLPDNRPKVERAVNGVIAAANAAFVINDLLEFDMVLVLFNSLSFIRY